MDCCFRVVRLVLCCDDAHRHGVLCALGHVMGIPRRMDLFIQGIEAGVDEEHAAAAETTAEDDTSSSPRTLTATDREAVLVGAHIAFLYVCLLSFRVGSCCVLAVGCCVYVWVGGCPSTDHCAGRMT